VFPSGTTLLYSGKNFARSHYSGRLGQALSCDGTSGPPPTSSSLDLQITARMSERDTTPTRLSSSVVTQTRWTLFVMARDMARERGSEGARHGGPGCAPTPCLRDRKAPTCTTKEATETLKGKSRRPLVCSACAFAAHYTLHYNTVQYSTVQRYSTVHQCYSTVHPAYSGSCQLAQLRPHRIP